MKIQELAIIFIIIILPISLLLSEYTQFQIQTIKLQTEYDTKLTAATYDAIKAFQLNSTNSTTSDLANSKLRDLEASVNAFRNSIMSGFKLNGYTEEALNNYIPALVYTLYDGFYIYSPYENTNYRYEDTETGESITKTDASDSDIPTDDNGENLYGLKPYISYSCRYVKTEKNIDVVITYALDNYVTVQGKIGNDYVNKSGYLIDGIVLDGDAVEYNGVTIETEQLKEYLPIADINSNIPEAYPYAKINGIKYYLVDNYIEEKNSEGVTEVKNCIIYILNGTPVIQYKEGTSEFVSWRNLILNNDSAKQYYKDAYEFTEWFKDTDLVTLTYANAVDEVIDDAGETSITNIWNGNDTQIFNFDSGTNIENELSEFSQHRLAVIRHKIETNLAIAISNYNTYSGAVNVFQMPELKEDEWEHITHNISLISFLQGLNIGGKIYNGYSLVTNSESKEVVLEENIYILGTDSEGRSSYHKIGDKGFEDGTITINAGDYEGSSTGVGDIISAGRLNLDFEKAMLTDGNIKVYYYYPLTKYNASYNSIVMQNNVTTYDDIYAYVNDAQNNDLKKAFYTALGRERYSAYKSTNIIENYYSVLVVGMASGNSNNEPAIKNITNELNKMDAIKATYVYNNDKTILANYIKEQKNNYNLIIVNAHAWPIGSDISSVLPEIANTTNLITISNDATGLPMMQSYVSVSGEGTVNPQITDIGKNTLGADITISSQSDTGQNAIKFNDDVEVFYKGTYTSGLSGEYDFIGSWEKGTYKWIHSQLLLKYYESNAMQLLKELVKYALEIK